MDVWQLRLARIRRDDHADDQEEYDSDESSWVRIAHVGEAMMTLEGQREAALKLRLRRISFRKSQCQTSSSRQAKECAVDDHLKNEGDAEVDVIDENELWKFYSY